MTSILDELWMLAKPKDSKGAWTEDIWPIVRTNRGDLEKAWNTVMRGKSDIEKQNTLGLIKLALPVIAKQRKGEKQARKMAQPVGIGVFIRGKRWIGCCDAPEVTQKTNGKCSVDDCNNPAQSERLPVCIDHHYQNLQDDWFLNRMRQEYVKLGRPEGQAECVKKMLEINPSMTRLIGRGE